MFHKEFYPTPEPLIEKLLAKYYIDDRDRYIISGNILEPSAGKGDIIDFIQDKCSSHRLDIFAIEINPDLQEILRSKEVALVDTDFLSYSPDIDYDFIFMNPPFSKGAEHLLKAIEVATHTKIACILNAETIKNPYTRTRKSLVQMITELGGEVEYVEDAFVDAERQTGVEVALIWLDIRKEEKKFDFDFIDEEEIFSMLDMDFSQNGVAKKDFIGNMQIRYEMAKKAYEEKLKADKKYDYYINQFLDGDGYMISGDFELTSGSPQSKMNHLLRNMKRIMWNKAITEMEIKKHMSSEILKNFERFVSMQSKMAFTKENVFAFFAHIMGNKQNIIEQSIVEIFDVLTSHGYRENRMTVETWKTNSAYKINRKIIAPSQVRYGAYCDASYLKNYGDKFSLGYEDWNYSKLSDLDKALCHISGKSQNDIIHIRTALEQKFNEIGKVRTGDTFDTKCESTFFEIRFYKKGTIHLKFKDEWLWNEFNYRACKGKNWLPADEYRTEDRPENQPQGKAPNLLFLGTGTDGEDD